MIHFTDSVRLFLGSAIRLLGGEGEQQGNVYVSGKPVCDDGWNINAGKVACRQSGYTGVLEIKLGEYDTYVNKRNFFKPGKKMLSLNVILFYEHWWDHQEWKNLSYIEKI